MIKKFILGLAILSLAIQGRAMAQQHSFSGNVMSPERTLATGGRSSSNVSYGCNDDRLGYFDLCIDVFVINPANGTRINMDTAINPVLGKRRPNILVRYWVVSERRDVLVSAGSKQSGGQTPPVVANTNQILTFNQISRNGGTAWSGITMILRDL